jgi:uncharacterized protein
MPTLANGKVCRQRPNGHIAFDDTTGEVVGRKASAEPGLLLYIMVDSVAATLKAGVLAHGGELAQPIGADAPEVTARFRDPAT